MTDSTASPSTQRRRRPRRSQGKSARKPSGASERQKSVNAVKALEQAGARRVDGPAEKPLTPDEIAQLKATFRFLKEHRKVLKLRVNAAEDLLLNGVQEPQHRGVCQHLLGKVDKARVLQASRSLPPEDATRLLAGVIRFAPDLEYVTRFVECVKVSAGQERASAALTRALASIDWHDTSDAQIRKLLQLIVDVFPESEQPAFLLGLLRSRSFREAIERSENSLPAAIANMVVPLRELDRLLASAAKGRRQHRPRRPAGHPEHLRRGALLLMRVNPQSLLEFGAPVRRRLFEMVCELSASEELPPKEALLALFRSLQFSGSESRGEAILNVAMLLLRGGSEKEARALLRDEAKAGGETGKEAGRLLELLLQPRIGSVALRPPRRRSPSKGKSKGDDSSRGDQLTSGTQRGAATKLPPAARWYAGVTLPARQSVRVRWAEASDRSRCAKELELWCTTLVPQVALPMMHDVSESVSQPYWVVEHFDASLKWSLERADEPEVRAVALELIRLEAALTSAQREIPDGDLARFARDSDGHVWLVDLDGVSVCCPAEEGRDSRPVASWLIDALTRVAQIAPGVLNDKPLAEGLGGLALAQALELLEFRA